MPYTHRNHCNDYNARTIKTPYKNSQYRPPPVIIRRGASVVFPPGQSGKESMVQIALGLLHCYYCRAALYMSVNYKCPITNVISPKRKLYLKFPEELRHYKCRVWAKNKRDAKDIFCNHIGKLSTTYSWPKDFIKIGTVAVFDTEKKDLLRVMYCKNV